MRREPDDVVDVELVEADAEHGLLSDVGVVPDASDDGRERTPGVRGRRRAWWVGAAVLTVLAVAAATAVAAPPSALLTVNGISSARLYYRDLLARMGVAVQLVRAGAYKSAAEPLVRTGPSPEAKEATATRRREKRRKGGAWSSRVTSLSSMHAA